MAAPRLSDDLARQALMALRDHPNKVAAAQALGIPINTFRSRIERARAMFPEPEPAAFEVPELPDETPTAEELIARRIKQFQRKSDAKDARKLVPVKVKIDGPFGLALFGDPHVDDDGTDIALLQRHVDMVNRTEGLFGANVGDYSNNWVGRLARLYSEQSVSAAEAWVLVEWLIHAVPWMFLIGGNHDCLDMDTEALTKRGWKTFDQIRPGDEVFGRDHEGAGVWQPILSTVHRRNTENMVAIDGPISMRVTPNHRVLCDWRRKWRDQFEFRAASNLPGSFRIPVALSARTDNVPDLSNEQIELAGWILTDGSIQWQGKSPRISIWQSKPSTRIAELLRACGIAYKEIERDRPVAAVCGRTLLKPPLPQREYRLSAAESRKVLAWVPEKGRLPEWAWRINDRQFSALLDGLIGGDGCWDGKTPWAMNCAVLHGERPFLDSVQAIAVQHGWRTRLSVAREKDYRLNLYQKTTVEMHKSQSVREAPPSEHVWCLTVPFGNFMVRRAGTAYITGNCWSGAGDPVKWMARSARVSYEAHGMRLGLETPTGRVIRVNARHDFSGKSQWNTAHGPSKAAQMGWRDHLLVCGHTHQSGYQIVRDPATGLLSHALRVGSYKTFDRYADEKGLPNQTISPCVAVIVQPTRNDDDPGLITVFHDVEMGANVLKFLRKRKA